MTHYMPSERSVFFRLHKITDLFLKETTPTDTDGELHRLGLLAVACSDGKLRILRYICVCVCAWSLLEKGQ